MTNVDYWALGKLKMTLILLHTFSASVPTFTVSCAAAVTPFTVAAPAGPRAAFINAFAPGGGLVSAVSKPASILLTAHCTALPAHFTQTCSDHASCH